MNYITVLNGGDAIDGDANAIGLRIFSSPQRFGTFWIPSTPMLTLDFESKPIKPGGSRRFELDETTSEIDVSVLFSNGARTYPYFKITKGATNLLTVAFP